ncbi:MlaC/ttg2D family ABC transporter substrate-binding protein [Motilimonas pumila]|uniref:ABC transporter substrate-binding protein n=1 Tax=Motilimonas pumila TaxID=2303987 RepID=A0A418YHZ7_9GAMM|nr:ABC transporter substrate-binding protein [Motilimonas pumila]RJG50008.1 hypothetical protein D1Z90_05015 [Motilimonas pumila]
MMRLFCVLLFLITGVSHANEVKQYTDPYALIEEVAGQAFARVKNEREQMLDDPAYADQVVKDELLPYVDTRYAAYKVIGPTLRDMSKAQRDRFADAFKEHMIQTYSNVLFKYDQQTLQFAKKVKLGTQRVIDIPVHFVQAGQPDIKVTFKLRKNKKTSVWLVFDVVAEGVSLLDTKKSELAGLIRSKGIDEVTLMLEQKNAETRPVSKTN